VKRRRVLVGSALLLAAGAAALLRPRPPEEFPLAHLVPADAFVYAGFPHWRELEARLGAFLPEDSRRKLDEAKPHLAGPVAVYLDRERRWVFLARLTRISEAFADVEDGAAVVAESSEALARHKARKGALADLASFRALRSRVWIDLEPLRLPGRLRDFSALGLELGEDRITGRATYRGGLFRLYLEQYLKAPGRGAPPGAATAALADSFVRLWDDFLHGLGPADREKAEREGSALARHFLQGRSLRDFLKDVGPGWGVSLVPTPHGPPALVGWVDLAGEDTRDKLGKMLHRLAQDGADQARDKGEPPPVDLAADGGIWRLKFPWAAALRLGEAFTPAYRLDPDRLVFTTCASILEVPVAPPGEGHVAAAVELAPALELVRGLAPLLADGAFRDEAERTAAGLYAQVYTPAVLAALRRQRPDVLDRERFLAEQKAQLAAKALGDLQRTPRYEEELRRRRVWIDGWAGRFAAWSKAELSGRFSGEGFDFRVSLRRR
jgi:hypothetical protein